uniref:DUF1775 domain-containing protein n=1 Tax=Paractinoplanes polyasparticus TaxID=2856853 RepID=UPI001C853337|nr:DUF1775 domain-containing protein [Actinoplanes polyasparticus]
MTTIGRRAATYAAAALLGTAAALSLAGPAAAHTGITIEPAKAGAKNAIADVNAEAESQSAGVTKVQIFLPAGIVPADITAVSLPKQWKLTKQDTSYTVAGPALAVGTNAEHKVRIRQLPMYAEISFRVLQSYSDGKTDRWIALPSKDDPEPANPAPTVKLAGGTGVAPTATPSPSPSPSANPSSSPSASSPSAPGTVDAAPPATNSSASSGSNAGWWIGGGILLVVLIAGALLLARSRDTSRS